MLSQLTGHRLFSRCPASCRTLAVFLATSQELETRSSLLLRAQFDDLLLVDRQWNVLAVRQRDDLAGEQLRLCADPAHSVHAVREVLRDAEQHHLLGAL